MTSPVFDNEFLVLIDDTYVLQFKDQINSRSLLGEFRNFEHATFIYDKPGLTA